MHPPSRFFFFWGGGWVKKSRKVFAWGEGGGQRFLFFLGGGGHRVLKENLRLHIPSIKSIFRITSLVYFRCKKGKTKNLNVVCLIKH